MRPMLTIASTMARARRLYFHRNLGSSAYISWREGRMASMIFLMKELGSNLCTI